ncbi:MAG: hypothetical protein HOY78_47180, partial [Saccharothrix sp.]|nr:hypothetical protein [Saccharothrix sp.]
ATGGSREVGRLRELLRAAREKRTEAARPDAEARAGARGIAVGRVPGVAAALRERPDLVEAAASAGRVVLTGAGGVGKSQVAAAVFRRASVEVSVWVSAGSRRSVITGYARAWRALGEVEASDEDAADLFVGWLRTTGTSWLVVLDDLDDLAVLSGLWPEGCGRTLVTTRRREGVLSRPDVRVVPVDVFTPEEAAGYLVERLSVDPRHGVAELVSLAEALGGHPLALAQAAAFLVDTGLTVPAYLDRLADRRRPVADLFPASSPADEHDGTVVDVVARAVEAARALSPGAPAMLELVSLLGSAGIPEEVLLHGHDLLALRALHRVHLVTHRDGFVEVHPLVQRVVRELLKVPPAVAVPVAASA